MKTLLRAAATPAVRQQTRNSAEPAPRRRRGRLDGAKTPRPQKEGAYKRVEIFLGVEAAIALRRLMRDGRSAREVIEALLLDANRPRAEELAPNTVRRP